MGAGRTRYGFRHDRLVTIVKLPQHAHADDAKPDQNRDHNTHQQKSFHRDQIPSVWLYVT